MLTLRKIKVLEVCKVTETESQENHLARKESWKES